MRTIWRLLKDYALVLVAIFVAGVVTGACRAIQAPPPRQYVTPTCVEAIYLMPNWIRDWNPKRLDRRT